MPTPGNQNWWRWTRDSLRSRLSDVAKRWDEFDEPARKHVAVEEPKEHELLDAPIRLTQQLLETSLVAPNAQNQSFGAGDLARPARGPSLQQTAVGRVLNAR